MIFLPLFETVRGAELFRAISGSSPFSLHARIIQTTVKTMFSRNSYSIFRRARYSIVNNIGYSTTNIQESGERDPAPLFFNEDVQNFLKTLTRPDEKKVFRKRKEGKRIVDPVYKFMTDEELKKQTREAEIRGSRRLQMPPVVKKRTEINSVLSKDPALQGHDTAKYVFTDITYPMSDYRRLIVVREPDGTLRHAKWEERQRFNQIYYPLKGRELKVPRMFREQYLQDLISRREYEFILDRACVQFDPNDPEYHRVTEMVYSAMNRERHFDKLRSTRHYGPLIFHLIWTKNIDNILLENIETERLEDAALFIELYNKIHPDAESAKLQRDGDDIEFIRDFVSLESSNKGKLEMSLQALKEIREARIIVAEGVKKAHGF